jgi:hypothetical protein
MKSVVCLVPGLGPGIARLGLVGAMVLLLTPLFQSWGAEVIATEEEDAVRVTSPYLHLKMSLSQPAFIWLVVDSLGAGGVGTNALRAPTPDSTPYRVKREKGGRCLEYRHAGTPATTPPGWRFEVSAKTLRLVSRWSEAEKPEPLVFEFDPRRCHVTLLGSLNADGSVRLPALMHFPDQGSFRISLLGGEEPARVTARDKLSASLGYDARRVRSGYVKVIFPAATPERRRLEYRWEIVAIHPKIAGSDQDARFDGFRRNWLNVFQLNPRLRVLANHAASDTCAFCLYEYADIARATPPLAKHLTALDLVRQSLDRYLEGLAGYGLPGFSGFDGPVKPSQNPPYSDSYPSLLIAATEYVAGSGDNAWLARQYGGLQEWADKLLATDRDGNGLFEHPYSGNSQPWSGKVEQRASNWWDTIGFGHEDAYANALAYRALRGMECLAARLSKAADANRYHAAADKLRAAFYNTFYNPDSGVLAGWRSADGQLHDYYFLFVNGIAIHYGLVSKAEGNAIMDRLLAKMKEVGYTRFDLGLPGNLVPVARKDYMHRERRWGGGQREDNSDGFQIYENGGATACFAYFTLAALYDLGRLEEADRMLFPLLAAFEKGGFQGKGARGMSNDWKAWDGTPWGYEGFLVDNYYALLAVMEREKATKARALK